MALPSHAQVFKSPTGEVHSRAPIQITTNNWVDQPRVQSDACGIVLLDVDPATVKRIEVTFWNTATISSKFTLTEANLTQMNQNRDTRPTCINGVRQPTQFSQNPNSPYFYADGKLAVFLPLNSAVNVDLKYGVDQTKTAQTRSCGIARLKTPSPDAKFNGTSLADLPTQHPPLCRKGVLYLPVQN